MRRGQDGARALAQVQVRVPIRARPRGHDRAAQPQPSVLIEPAPPIANLFSRAQEGIGRGDWKFAIDSLQRIIDDPQGSLLPRRRRGDDGGVLYESARRHASRKLGALPPRGLEAYRLIYDGKAKALWQRGQSDHDAEALRMVTERYLLTSYGDDASDLLASWALDEGRPDEAVDLLTALTELVPDSDVPQALIAAKLAVARTWLGLNEDAVEMAPDQPARRGADVRASDAPDSVRCWLLNATFSSDPELRGAKRSGRPTVDGSARREGAMPAVKPTLQRRVPWHVELVAPEAFAWRPTVSGDPEDTPVAPPGRLVADDARLYARTPRGCVALDAEDLSRVWEVDRPARELREPASRLPVLIAGAPPAEPKGAGLFEDHVAWGAAVCGDLVMILQRESDAALGGGRRFGVPRRGRSEGAGQTWLVALDAATGELRWECGRAEDTADPLGHVEFRATPIMAGEKLWVAVQRQRDLMLAALDPRDGSVIRLIVLGMLPRSDAAPWHPLALAADDRAVYVPSGYGALFAVSIHDYSVRWANEYGLAHRAGEETEWRSRTPSLASAPVVSEGVVLLAPLDRRRVFAFSTVDGQLRWSAAVGDGTYIIAVDAGRVWLGGRRLVCFDRRNGDILWTRELDQAATGRAVLSGDLLYVPTWNGLVSLEALSGTDAGRQQLPASATALGNLLCLHDAMYSLDAGSVRKFPDVAEAYPKALARYEADPADAFAAVRLAWIELLRDEPARAYELVRGLAETAAPARIRASAEEAARVRVEALLALSQAPDVAPNRALGYLKEASATAKDAEDRLRCGFALADHLRRMERYADAHRHLLNIGLSAEAGRAVSVGDYVMAPARFDIARRLAALRAKLPEADRAALQAALRERVTTESSRLLEADSQHEAEATLRAIADLYDEPVTGEPTPPQDRDVEADPLGTAAVRSLMRLADRRATQMRGEQAEQLLREAVRGARDTAEAVRARVALAEFYGAAQTVPAALRSALYHELDARFGREAFPGGGEPNVGAWVARQRARFLGAGANKPAEPSSRTLVGLTGDVAWPGLTESEGVIRNAQGQRIVRGQSRGVRKALVDFGPDWPAWLSGSLVVLDADAVLHAHATDNGQEVWQAPLQLPGDFEHAAFPASGGSRRAVADGQIGVFRNATGLYAVGLTTGKRIWARRTGMAAKATGLPEADAAYGREIAMASGDGWLVATLNPGRLTKLRILDGATLWERDLRGEAVASLRSDGSVIVTADRRRRRVFLIDAASGALIRRVLYQQPDSETSPVDLVVSGGYLCGPVSSDTGDALMAVALADGEPAWRMSLPKPLTTLMRPAPSYIGVGLLGGELRIVDAATGEIVLTTTMPGAQRVTDATLWEGTLLVRHGMGDDRQQALRGLDVATGAELWHRDDVAPWEAANVALRVRKGVLPVVFRPREEGRRPGGKLTLTMVDARTGADIGATVELAQASWRGQAGVEVRVLDGLVVVTTPQGVFPLATQSMDASASGGA